MEPIVRVIHVKVVMTKSNLPDGAAANIAMPAL